MRTVYLATDSIPHRGNESVILIGRGATEPAGDSNYDKIWDRRIRQAEFTTITMDKCMADTKYYFSLPSSQICALRKDDRAVGSGDSGKEFYLQMKIVHFINGYLRKQIHFAAHRWTIDTET